MVVDLGLLAAKDALQSQLQGGWSKGSKRVAGETKMTLGKEHKESDGIRGSCEFNDQRGRGNCSTMSSVMIKMADR